MSFVNVTNQKVQKELNAHLATRSYMEGYLLSAVDFKTFDEFGKAPEITEPNVLRWYNHIKSFSSEERKSVEKKPCPLSAGAKTTVTSTSVVGCPKPVAKEAPKPTAPSNNDDDDVDLFGSDDEDTEAARIRNERLKEYAAKKSKKPALIAKSSIVLDVKPWDDETDMTEMEKNVRTIVQEGLVWGASKLVPVGYGIKKLQIMCVVEDDKVSVEELVEKIQDFEEFVQSVDIAAFNKI